MTLNLKTKYFLKKVANNEKFSKTIYLMHDTHPTQIDFKVLLI